MPSGPVGSIGVIRFQYGGKQFAEHRWSLLCLVLARQRVGGRRYDGEERLNLGRHGYFT